MAGSAELGERFVRANVISYADFVACGFSEKEAKAKAELLADA